MNQTPEIEELVLRLLSEAIAGDATPHQPCRTSNPSKKGKNGGRKMKSVKMKDADDGDDWTMAIDEASGRMYFYNKHTREVCVAS
jgi:hypothetical protein